MSHPGPEADSVSFKWRPDRSLLLPLAIYLVAAVLMWKGVIARADEISYTLDDAYIHAALAKNLVAHGTLGIVPGEFSAASSSPLWTLILALGFAIAGFQAWVPGILATVFGALAIERAHACLKTLGLGPMTRSFVVCLAMIYAPVLPVLSTGMEHLLHIWTMLGLFNALLRAVPEAPKRPFAIFIWAILAAGARYESLFILPPLLLWLAWRRNWRTAFALGGGMSVPVLAFAACSMSHGGYPLPNSLMLKGNFEAFDLWIGIKRLIDWPYLSIPVLLMAIATVFLIVSGRGLRLAWFPITIIVLTLIHLELAKLGWFWRYEAYLTVLGIISASTLLIPLREWLKGRHWLVLVVVQSLLVFSTLPLLFRSILANAQIVPAVGNIHDQQVQMARVGRLLGPQARIAVNDLGAMAFFTDAHVLDLWGLGDNRITRAKRDHYMNSDFLRQRLLEDHTEYVICYPSWFLPPAALPDTLIPVERWHLNGNIICGAEDVYFYGTSPEAAQKLTDALTRYRLDFPADPRSTNQIKPIATK